MKTKSIRNIFVLALILFSVVGCGRYEEGPWISFRSPERRLCGKKWHVVSFMKNDSDLTSQWTTNYDWRLYFDGYNDSELDECASFDVFVGNTNNATGSWNFDTEDPDGLSVNVSIIHFGFTMINDMFVVDGIYPLLSRIRNKYTILKLKHDELWLEHTDSIQNEYVIKFENN
ncbi:hypothetical protein SDC9_72051 [bioreactor metagenome]|uniref:Lipocalin-like domain-containing protein n=1 Tax=bioreactor metagenome TaxID=1076179 RepID=A0A644YAI4_9ZZZZ